MLTQASLLECYQVLAGREPVFKRILETWGAAPLWEREPGFATLIWIILEQQVSLASARAAFQRLEQVCPQLTPENFLALDDLTLLQAGFSRQKKRYSRGLAQALIEGELDLAALATMEDGQARGALMKLKGIGPWTADIYLLMALRREDIWPVGDRALAVAIQQAWEMEAPPAPGAMEQMARPWQPFRAAAARLLWHDYLCQRRQPD